MIDASASHVWDWHLTSLDNTCIESFRPKSSFSATVAVVRPSYKLSQKYGCPEHPTMQQT